MWRREGGREVLPLNHALSDSIPQCLQAVKHRISLFILVHPALPLGASTCTHSPGCFRTHASPTTIRSLRPNLFLWQPSDTTLFRAADVVREAVCQRYDFNEEEVQAGAAEEGRRRVTGIVGR